MLSDFFLYAALDRSYGGYPISRPSYLTNRIPLATTQLSRQITADTVQISGYGKLQAAVSAFQGAVKGFQTTQSVSSFQAISSDAAVASAIATATASAGSYDLAISQVAQAQGVVSDALADPDATVVGSGTLTIQLGEYDSGPNSFTPGASPSVAINVTNGSLNSIASAINAADAGVTATVIDDGTGYRLSIASNSIGAANGFSLTVTEPSVAINVTNGSLNSIASAINAADAGVTATVIDDGTGYRLSIASNSTGAANGFSLTVTDGDGNNTDTAGLSQLAFDPTAAAGAGKNLTQTRAAQDAAYTIDGIAATSATNSNVSIAPGLTVNLLTAGSTTISVTESATALSAAAQGLVDAYNDLVGTIKDLTGAGGELAGDSVSATLLPALTAELSNNHAGSLNYLYQLGVTAEVDGTLSLDDAALEAAFNADPAGAKALLNNAAISCDAVVDPYVKPGGIISSVNKVVQQDLAYLESRGVGLDAIGSFSQEFANRQYSAALARGYAAALNESIYATLSSQFSSGSTAFPSKGFSLFA